MAKLKKEELMSCYYEKLLLFGAMEYYSLREEKAADPAMEKIERAVAALLEGREGEEEKEALAASRQELRERMDILTAYVDRLEIYEYALNRVELRFTENLEQIEEEAFLQKTIQYIFSSKDNVIINESIREIIGQLPVRMTKGKYFERLKNSLSIYKGADKSSLDSMLYMLRTSGMLYRPEKEGLYYAEYKEVVKKAGQIDFAHMTKEMHQEMEGLLERTGEGLRKEMDQCMALAEAVNHFYGVYLLKDFLKDRKEERPELRRLLEASRAGDFDMAEEMLKKLEGRLERLAEKELVLERGLFEADREEPGMKELLTVQALSSSSLFMEFSLEEEKTVVTQELLEEETNRLTAELKELFSSSPMLINRAVMANTLSKLPVFFETSEEVMEYIQNSLEQCHDAAEKTMSMKLIYHMMEG